MGQKAGLGLGRYVRSLVSHRTVPLSSPSRIPGQAYGGAGGQMAITVQMQFTSAVTEIYQDAFVGSSIENGTTVIQFDLRQHDFQQELGTKATLCWRKESYHVDIHELSTFHNPITYRFIVAQGSYLNDQHQRVYFTPELKGVSTSQHMSHSVIRLACYLAVVCGVSLRHIALLFSVLFLIPITKSSVKRWIDGIGVHLPTPEEILRHLLALTPATECHIDGYYPRGTDHCVMVVKDEHDRILMTHEAASENGDDARQFLQRLKTDGVSRLQTNKYNSTCWPYCHGHALPPSWLKACNPARNGGAHDHHGFYHSVVL